MAKVRVLLELENFSHGLVADLAEIVKILLCLGEEFD